MPTRKWGSEKLVNTILPGDQFDSHVAGLTGGSFVVVWQEYEPTTNDSAIWAQHYDALGNRVGGELAIASAPGTDFVAPAVTALANGGFYVTATQLVGPDNFILGFVYDANGAFVRTQHVDFPLGLDTNSDVSRRGTGSVVAWEDPDANSGDVLFRIFDAAGNHGVILTANSTTNGLQSKPAVAAAPLGGTIGGGSFVVVWESIGGAVGVRARIFDAAGNQVAAEFNVAEIANGAQQEPAVTWLNDDQFVVAWKDGSGLDGSGTCIRARIFGSLGFAMTGEIAVNSTVLSGQETPTITALPSGGFVVSWKDWSGTVGTGSDISGSAVRLQAFDAGGGKIGGEFLVNTTTFDQQSPSEIAALADGRVVVTWVDQSSGNNDVRMQIVDPRDGIVNGTAAGEALYGHDAVDDEISGFDGEDILRGLRGDDQLYGGAGADDLYGGNGEDVLYGGAGADVLLGEAGDDDLFGEDGNDDLRGGAGADNLDGGLGSDTANYGTLATGVTVALDGSLAASGEAAGDIFTSVEFLKGSNSASSGDTLRGDAGANSIFGNAGNDSLSGMAGHDKLIGGAGTDNMSGGTGNDQFIYNALTELPDVLTDFTSNAAGNNDVFLFKGSVFGTLPAGALPAAQFQSSTANVAANGNIRFFYETDTRVLRFDADGSGGGSAPIVVATLQVGATMTFQDIMIF